MSSKVHRVHYSLFIIFLLPLLSHSCSTIVAGREATTTGAVIVSHSNDGDGDVAGNLRKVPPSSYTLPSNRSVSRGSIPQVAETVGYFTEGYAIMNEYQVSTCERSVNLIFLLLSQPSSRSLQVALGESTCVGIYPPGGGGILNIVDLGQLCLERSRSASECIDVMGSLASTYGYNDNAESLFVTDTVDAYVFHILPSSTGTSSIWVAQLIPPSHVSAVMNAFIIRNVDLSSDLYSSNLLYEASLLGWDPSTPLDFSLLFSGDNEGTCKYSSGRRVWSVFNNLSPSISLSPTYSSYLQSNYGVSHPPDKLVNATTLRTLMRDTFEGTPYALSTIPAGGPFSTPSRWVTPQLVSNETVCWERSISIFRSIVTIVAESRSWLPDPVGGLLHFTSHSSRAAIYSPFVVGMKVITPSYSSNSMATLGRGVSAFWGARYLYNILEIRADLAILDVREMQRYAEDVVGSNLTALVDDSYSSGSMSLQEAQDLYNTNAERNVVRMWDMSDEVVMNFADGYCNDCGEGTRHLGYPQQWLDDVYKKKERGKGKKEKKGKKGKK